MEIILITLMNMQFMIIKEIHIQISMIILNINMPILMIMIVDLHSTTLIFLKILLMINPISLNHVFFLKIHLFTIDHLRFILHHVLIKLIILCSSL